MINANNNSPVTRYNTKNVFTGKNSSPASSTEKMEKSNLATTIIPDATTANQPNSLPITPQDTASLTPNSSNLNTLFPKQKEENQAPKQSMPKQNKNNKKIFGLEAKAVGAVLGLALFLTLSMGGVLIALRQRLAPEQVAVPTAPKSTPSAYVEPSDGSCTLSFEVEANIDATCTKVSYKNEPTNTAGNYTLLTEQTQFMPEDIVVYQIEVANNGNYAVDIDLTDVLTGSTANLDYLTFLDSDCAADSFDPTTKTLTCILEDIAPAQTDVFVTFRAQVNTDAPEGKIVNTAEIAVAEDTETQICLNEITIVHEEITYECNSDCTLNSQCQTADDDYVCSTTYGNKCRLSDNLASTTCEPAEVTYECNSDCTTNAQCQTADDDYVCSTTYGNKCRLSDNLASTTCTPVTNSYACNSTCTTNAQCQTANANYICYNNTCRLDSNPSASNCQPDTTTTIGCNDACTANADCDNSAHICYNSQCRLATNPTNEQCLLTTTTTSKGGQPTLPAQLPKSGSQDVLNWLKAGAGVLGIGTVLLLLL